MKFAVFVSQPGQEEIFLQSSNDLNALIKKPKAYLSRWLFEMSVEISDPVHSKFVLTEDGKPVFERFFIGVASKSWKPVA